MSKNGVSVQPRDGREYMPSLGLIPWEPGVSRQSVDFDKRKRYSAWRQERGHRGVGDTVGLLIRYHA